MWVLPDPAPGRPRRSHHSHSMCRSGPAAAGRRSLDPWRRRAGARRAEAAGGGAEDGAEGGEGAWEWVLTPKWAADADGPPGDGRWVLGVDRPVAGPGGIPEFWVTAMCRCR
jgi:hypothetical protein